MQVFGLSATTGILAIALPYAGICAKVYSEIIEEADLSALRVLPRGHRRTVSAFLYARLPDVASASFRHYTLYRFECAMRSTLVLGFIGLPTMGFYLESAFRQGRYAEAGALLLVFYALIGSRRLWVRAKHGARCSIAASALALPATDRHDQRRRKPRRASSPTTSSPRPCGARASSIPPPCPASGPGSRRS